MWKLLSEAHVGAPRRLPTASTNAMCCAAERPRVEPIDLAEQLGDGKLADLLAPHGGRADSVGGARFVVGVVWGCLAGEAEDLAALADWVEEEIERLT